MKITEIYLEKAWKFVKVGKWKPRLAFFGFSTFFDFEGISAKYQYSCKEFRMKMCLTSCILLSFSLTGETIPVKFLINYSICVSTFFLSVIELRGVSS